VFVYGFSRRIRIWRSGRPEARGDRVLQRCASLARYALGQKKIMEKRFLGLAHLGLVIGFTVPLFCILAVQVPFVLPLCASRALGLFLDLSGLCGIAGVVGLAGRRILFSTERLKTGPQDWLVLAAIAGIFLTGYVVAGGRIALTQPDHGKWMPLRLMFSMVVPANPTLVAYVWRLHFLLVVCFLAYVPYSKALHMVTVPLNIYYGTTEPVPVLSPVPMRRGVVFGASRKEEFTWKQLLDADACMGCGRCEEECPAFLSGKQLSPKKIIQDLRRHMERDPARQRVERGRSSPVPSLVGGRITEEEIWACTTCYACHRACPACVEHVPAIIGMRRFLVLDTACFPATLTGVFRNLEVYGDTYGKGVTRREVWRQGLGVKTLRECGGSEYLLWIGCEGTFHERNRAAVASLIEVLLKAKVDVAVLGKEERCCGEIARKVGNEYLFHCCVRNTLEMLMRYGVEKIITFCPHCFHALKNEYPRWGSTAEVFHYTEILAHLVEEGCLEMKIAFSGKVTYHDPCYLGRINRKSSYPRTVLRAVPGTQLVEMAGFGEKTLCCGAGGGRAWMEEQASKRINRQRIHQAIAVGADVLVTSCPYCLTMCEDAVISMNGDALPKVVDLAELVARLLG